MRLTLMHNPKAGHDSPSDDELVKALKKADYKVDYQSTKKKDWAEALEEPGELVVVAGGDGTVAKVAGELAGRGIPLAILPLGTANNIAHSLGIPTDDPLELIDGWAAGRRRKFDVGVASGPWGERRFLEAIGLGLFTQAMAIADTREEPDEPADRAEELRRDLKLVQMTLSTCRSRPWRLTLDGEDASFDGFLLEIQNIQRFGPGLHLAAEASPGDGRLHVVRLVEEDRGRFARYLERRLDGRDEPLELPALSGRRVQLRWDGTPLHVDDEVFSDPQAGERDGENGGAVVDIWLDSEIEILVPAARAA